MKRYNLLYILCLMIFLLSCTENKADGKWEVNLLNEEVDSIGYSLFVDSIEYIALETNDSCLIKKVSDMAFSEQHLFVFDEPQQTIWVFDRKGKFLNKICKKGTGPGEYSTVHRFEYDAKNNRIAVLSSFQQKLLYYTLQGEYIKTVKLGVKAQDFKLCPEGGIVLSNAGMDDASAGIYFQPDSTQVSQLLVSRKPNHLVYFTPLWELCSYDHTVCFMAPNFDNVVYHYQDNQLTTEYPFQMKPGLSQDYEESVSLQHFNDFLRTVYLEGNQWIYAAYWSSLHDLRLFLYSKEQDKYWVGKNLVNDIDKKGGGAWQPVTDRNVFVTCLEHENPDENPVIGILHLK